jgi:glucose-1-phosphate cytidylyltransferase
VLDYITEGDPTIFERAPLEKLATDGELYTYQHEGFWRPMDTLRDKNTLEELWKRGEAKWKVWK